MDSTHFSGIWTDSHHPSLKTDFTHSELKEGDVRIKVFSAPVNPSDYLFATGNYMVKKEGPVGFEGSGEIVATAEGVDPTLIGKKAAFACQGGSWSQFVVVPHK